MGNGANRHVLTKADLLRRRGDRKLQALLLLAPLRTAYDANLAKAHSKRRNDIPIGTTPLDLASRWDVHPTSAFRVLERLRKAGAVDRAGVGIGAIYWITDSGLLRIPYLREKAKFDQHRKRSDE